MKKIIASLLIVGNTFMYRLLPKDAREWEGRKGCSFTRELCEVIYYNLWPTISLMDSTFVQWLYTMINNKREIEIWLDNDLSRLHCHEDTHVIYVAVKVTVL